MKQFFFSPKDMYFFGRSFLLNAYSVPSERGDTFEIENASLQLVSPLDRVATQEWRKMNVGFAIVEALQMIVGDDSLGPVTQFIPAYSEFSTNGRNIDGAYGPRIHLVGQYDRMLMEISKNKDTRRAVLSVYMGSTDLLGGGGNNTPCTLNLNFLVRRGRLSMTTMMRSNDIWRGLTNDIFVFTMLQEYTAKRLGLPLGEYTHFATSLHLYKSDYEHFTSPPDEPLVGGLMNPMPSTFDPNRVYKLIVDMQKWDASDCYAYADRLATKYYERDLFLSAAAIAKRRFPGAHQLANGISDKILKKVVSYWMPKEA